MPVRPPSCTSFFILLFGSGAPPPAIAFSCLALSNIFPSPITSATSSFTVAVIRFIDGTTNAGGRWFPLLRMAVAWSCAFKQPMPAGDENGQAPSPTCLGSRARRAAQGMDGRSPAPLRERAAAFRYAMGFHTDQFFRLIVIHNVHDMKLRVAGLC